MFEKPRVYWILILACLFLCRLALAVTLPVSVDAATSFNYFFWRPLAEIIELYPAPNNHVFYSVLAHFTLVKGVWITESIRIPSLLAGIAAILVFYRLLREHFQQWLAIASSALLAVLWPVMYYSVIARGYSLVLLMALVSCWLLLHLSNTRPWIKLIALSVTIALGCWSVPSFLYFVAPFGTAGFLFLILKQPLLAWKFALFVGLGLLLSFLLYLPIINHEGWEALAGNRYVTDDEGVSALKWFEHFQSVSSWYLQLPWAIFLFLPVAIWQAFAKRSLLSLLNASVFIWMFITPFLHGVLPFERNWIYVAPFMVLTLSWLIEALFRRSGTQQFIGVGMLLLVGLMTYISVQRSWLIESGGRAYRKIALELMEKGEGRLYIQEMYGQSYLPYFFDNFKSAEAAENLEVKMAIKGDRDFSARQLDSLSTHYDHVIMANHLPLNDSLRQLVVDTSLYYNLYSRSKKRQP